MYGGVTVAHDCGAAPGSHCCAELSVGRLQAQQQLHVCLPVHPDHAALVQHHQALAHFHSNNITTVHQGFSRQFILMDSLQVCRKGERVEGKVIRNL